MASQTWPNVMTLVHTPKFRTPISWKKIPDFSKIWPSVGGSCLRAFKDVKSKLGSSEKSQGRLKLFWGWGAWGVL